MIVAEGAPFYQVSVFWNAQYIIVILSRSLSIKHGNINDSELHNLTVALVT